MPAAESALTHPKTQISRRKEVFGGGAKEKQSRSVQSAGAKQVSKPIHLEVPELRVTGVATS